MASIGKSGSVATQLANGASIIAAYKTLNAQEARLIKPRMEVFIKEQEFYLGAHHQIGSTTADKAAATTTVSEAASSVDAGLDAVGRALIADGRELERPLATYGTASARQLMKLRPKPKIVAVRQLLVSLRSDKTLSKAPTQAVDGLQKAVSNAEASLAKLGRIETAINEARVACTAAGERWAKAFDALKAGCESAAYDGSPQLITIFNSNTRPRAKKTKASASSEATPPPSANGTGSAEATATKPA